MEEVGLPQVGWRLLLEVGSPDPRAVEDQCDHLGADCDTCWFYARTFHLVFFSPSFSREATKTVFFRTKA